MVGNVPGSELTKRCAFLANGSGSISTLDVVAELLGLLRTTGEQDTTQLRFADDYWPQHEVARAWWSGHLTRRLALTEVGEIEAALNKAPKLPVALLGWVKSFDELWSDTMRAWLPLGARPLKPGSLAPVALAKKEDLKDVHGKSLGANPASLQGKALVALQHWVVVPDPSPTMEGIELEAIRHPKDLGDVFDALTHRSRLGIGLPSLFEVGPEPHHYACKLDGKTKPPSFFSVSPPASQQSLLNQVFMLLEQEGAHLGILPELCLDEALRDGLVARFTQREPGSQPSILCAGSLHLMAQGEQRNRSVTMAGPYLNRDTRRREVARMDHDKLFPMPYRHEGEEHFEAISKVGRKLTVHYAGRWSFVTLICKDLMDEGLIGWLRELRVRLILIASTSPVTRPFETEASRLADGQSLVLVANAPWRQRPDESTPWWGGLRASASAAPAVLHLPGDADRTPPEPALPLVGMASLTVGGFKLVYPQ